MLYFFMCFVYFSFFSGSTYCFSHCIRYCICKNYNKNNTTINNNNEKKKLPINACHSRCFVFCIISGVVPLSYMYIYIHRCGQIYRLFVNSIVKCTFMPFIIHVTCYLHGEYCDCTRKKNKHIDALAKRKWQGRWSANK